MSLSPLAIHLFGPLRVLVQGEPMPRVRTRSVEWLLALLVLRQGRAVERSWLSGTLWLESEESRALQNLREDLVRLRKALGTESLRLQSPSRDTLMLDLSGAQVDVLAFDKAIARGDEASLRTAVSLYTAPLLEGCYEEWVSLERESREQACLAALETLAEFAEQREEWSEALSLLRRAEGMDGLRETTQRRLMRVLAQSGDTPAALLVYREHRLRLRREMNVEPDQETTRLFQQIRATGKGPMRSEAQLQPARAAEASTPASLPHPLTTLIGREEAAQDVSQRVAVSRLVTLVGTGGVGKTRLCIQVAHEAAEQFPHGAVFIALASLSDPALLPSLVASALGIREEGSADADALLQALIGRLSNHEALLVLDNCEHLIEATAQLTQVLLEHCPHLHILATSRQRLGLTGEVVWRVPSLSCPDPEILPPDEAQLIEAVMQSPAVQLFVERAKTVKPDLRLTRREDAEAVTHLCRRLDGIPLAIELAAARAGVLTLPQIASRLDDRFRLLTGGSRGVLTRHQTLRALIDWSYDLLSEPERALLRRLCVFVGGWSLEAAEQICALHGREGRDDPHLFPDEVLDLLTSLVDKSLVLVEDHATGLRYRMLETVREYALERLRESGQETAVRDQHLFYCLHLAREMGPALRGSDLESALERVEAEIGNFREALRWAQTETAPPDALLRLSAALWPFWEVRGYHTEGREHLRAALNRPAGPTDTPERAQALLGAAALAFVQADLRATLEFGLESLALLRGQNDPHGLAAALILCGHAWLESFAVPEAASLLEEALEYCRHNNLSRESALVLTHLGLVAMRQEDWDRARALLDEGLSVAETAGHALTLALCLHNRGYLYLASGIGDYASAVTLMEKSLEIWRRLGHGHKASLTLRQLGQMARRHGDMADALSYFEEDVAACREQGNRFHLAFALLEYGSAHYEQGDYESARRTYAESLELFTQVGNEWGVNAARMNLGCTLFHLGEPQEALPLHRDALAVFQRTQSPDGVVWALERLAVTAAACGEVVQAAWMLGAASVAREGLGQPLDRWDRVDWEQAVVIVRAALGEAALESAWAEGRAMSSDQAIEHALRNS